MRKLSSVFENSWEKPDWVFLLKIDLDQLCDWNSSTPCKASSAYQSGSFSLAVLILFVSRFECLNCNFVKLQICVLLRAIGISLCLCDYWTEWELRGVGALISKCVILTGSKDSGDWLGAAGSSRSILQRVLILTGSKNWLVDCL